jgi:hypothetical protein
MREFKDSVSGISAKDDDRDRDRDRELRAEAKS